MWTSLKRDALFPRNKSHSDLCLDLKFSPTVSWKYYKTKWWSRRYHVIIQTYTKSPQTKSTFQSPLHVHKMNKQQQRDLDWWSLATWNCGWLNELSVRTSWRPSLTTTTKRFYRRQFHGVNWSKRLWHQTREMHVIITSGVLFATR